MLFKYHNLQKNCLSRKINKQVYQFILPQKKTFKNIQFKVEKLLNIISTFNKILITWLLKFT